MLATRDADLTPHADLTDIPRLTADLRKTFTGGITRPIEWRKRQLESLRRMLEEQEGGLIAAARADLGKPVFEAFTAEIALLVREIAHTLRELEDWVKPQKVSTPLVQQPGESYIVRESLGVVLIIGPWNYPLQLVLAPLIGAIAAGNCAVLKPSELTPNCSNALAHWVPQYLDRSAFAVVEGGVPETSALLAQRFDHIFYTGGGAVGRIVMRAAAEHLTPVTLELGGKSPCIVDSAVDLDVAVKRIAWGKWLNAGQTCVAPDYLLLHRNIEGVFIRMLGATIRAFYGRDPRMSPDFARIVNVRHFKRLESLLGDGEVLFGGEAIEAERYIAPTVMARVALDSPLMTDEIFGPILPVVSIGSVDEAIDFINDRPRPLALYVFSSDRGVQQQVVAHTSSGGVGINETVTHLAIEELPFGGVGASGMGAYHGRASFETFSHRKSVFSKSTFVDLPLRYPPYTEAKLKWVKRLV